MKRTSWVGALQAAAVAVLAAIMAAVFAPAAWAAGGGSGGSAGNSGGNSGGYREIWNPPEARMFAPHKVSAARKAVRPAALSASAGRRHAATAHASRLAARPMPSSSARLMAKLMAKQNIAPKPVLSPEPAAPREPDMSDIPRQITPEGNVLRVRAQAASAAKVVR